MDPKHKLVADNPNYLGGNFGTSVAIDGNTVVVGAPSGWGAYQGTGVAYVFTEPASGWTNMTQTAMLVGAAGGTGDGFGQSVAVSGNTVVVGGGATVGANFYQGVAYVFTKPASGWANSYETADLTASDGAMGDMLGGSVSISGNTIVAGAGNAEVGTNGAQGAVYVFTESGSAWTSMTQTAKLTASDGAANDEFGWHVSISGNTVVVGAAQANSGQGAAYVFTGSGSNWTQAAKLTASDGVAGDNLGGSVSIGGNTVVLVQPAPRAARGRPTCSPNPAPVGPT